MAHLFIPSTHVLEMPPLGNYHLHEIVHDPDSKIGVKISNSVR